MGGCTGSRLLESGLGLEHRVLGQGLVAAHPKGVLGLGLRAKGIAVH